MSELLSSTARGRSGASREGRGAARDEAHEGDAGTSGPQARAEATGSWGAAMSRPAGAGWVSAEGSTTQGRGVASETTTRGRWEAGESSAQTRVGAREGRGARAKVAGLGLAGCAALASTLVCVSRDMSEEAEDAAAVAGEARADARALAGALGGAGGATTGEGRGAGVGAGTVSAGGARASASVGAGADADAAGAASGAAGAGAMRAGARGGDAAGAAGGSAGGDAGAARAGGAAGSARGGGAGGSGEAAEQSQWVTLEQVDGEAAARRRRIAAQARGLAEEPRILACLLGHVPMGVGRRTELTGSLVVAADGEVVRAKVRAGALPAAARACVEAELTRTRFAAGPQAQMRVPLHLEIQ